MIPRNSSIILLVTLNDFSGGRKSIAHFIAEMIAIFNACLYILLSAKLIVIYHFI